MMCSVMIRTIGSFVVMGVIALAMIPSHAMQQDPGLAKPAAESPAAGSATQRTEAQKTEMMLEKVRAAMAAAEARRLAGLQPDPGPDSKALADKWGVEVIGMRLTSAGYMLDFRFRVLDAKKADPLFVRQTKPYLVDQKTGKVLAVPNTAKIGPLRNSNTPQEGRIYWMFFGNHHGLVQKGDKVTVAIGDFRATDLVVN